MRVYRIEQGVEPYHYAGTKSEAHTYAKDNVPKDQWSEVKISELELQSDKEGVVAALNDSPVVKEMQAWGLTKRGGLEEWKE